MKTLQAILELCISSHLNLTTLILQRCFAAFIYVCIRIAVTWWTFLSHNYLHFHMKDGIIVLKTDTNVTVVLALVRP